MQSVAAGRPIPLLLIYTCIIAACLMAFLSFGVRTTFGVFLEPILQARGWERETFGLALAIQNLVWGLAQPLAGAMADRHGYGRVLVGGVLLYVAGIAGMALADTPVLFHLAGGVMAGLGLAGASWTMSVGAMTRVAPPHLHGWATGMAIAACSMGQFVLATVSQALIVIYDWQTALLIMAGCIGVILPCAILLTANIRQGGAAPPRSSLAATMATAAGSGSFWMIFAGFTICGLHAGFVFTHMPAYVVSLGLSAETGAWALGAIGLTNLFSAYVVGVLGQTRSKRVILIWIYACRALAMTALLLAPVNDGAVLLLSAVLGIFWMSSIPPTSGLLGQIFGPYYMATLLGLVFLGHQVGAFLGAWLGGALYDLTGSYATMWWISIALSAAAALVNIPVSVRPLGDAAQPARA